MFRDMGDVPSEQRASELLSESTAAIHAALDNGTYLGWLATSADGAVIGGAGVHIKPQLPRVTHDGLRVASGDVPLVVNVYTEPLWRQRGVARALMHALMQWATENGHDRVVLHASDKGRKLYESLGFAPTNEVPQNSPSGS